MVKSNFRRGLVLHICISLQSLLPTSTANEEFNCTFESDWCGWSNEWSDNNFIWERTEGSTQDKSTGRNFYVHVNASSLPSQPGVKARLTSSLLIIPGCMTFMYRLFGSEAGTIIVYVKGGDKISPVWIQARNHGYGWTKSNIYINQSENYQVFIDAIKGTSINEEIAIDDIRFYGGPCSTSVVERFHVYTKHSDSRQKFQVDTRYLADGWLYQFTFQAPQTASQEYNQMYFVYDITEKLPRSLAETLILNETDYRLISFFFSAAIKTRGLSKLHLFDQGNGTSLILTLEEKVECYGLRNVGSFLVHVTEDAEDSTAGCLPGWYRAHNKCYQINLSPTTNWVDVYHTKCRNQGAEMAVAFNDETVRGLDILIRKFRLVNHFLFVAAWSARDSWKWINDVPLDPSVGRWGPGIPSEIGRCASLTFFDGIGWWFSYKRCHDQLSYICERSTDNSSCPSNWEQTGSVCFFVSGPHKLQWDEARKACQKMTGLLAVLDQQAKINSLLGILNNLLHHQTNSNNEFFIGLQLIEQWYWRTGQYVKPFERGEEFPDKIGDCGSLLVTKNGPRFADVNCYSKYGYICERKMAVNVAYKKPASNFPVNQWSPDFAVDGKMATCARIEGSQKSWWSVDLGKDRVLTTVIIRSRPYSCLDRISHNLSVILSTESGINTTCGHVSLLGNTWTLSVNCPLLAVGRHVIIRDLTENQTIVLCEVSVITTDGNCDFDDYNFCEWRNDPNFDEFDWSIAWLKTSSLYTGPNTEETDRAYFTFIETSPPRVLGDRARLISPWMVGANCLMFDYHMYGATIGLLAVYTKTVYNETTPVWFQYGDKGDTWFTAHISLYNKMPYQVIIEGIRGNDYTGDAALDQLRHHEGFCTKTEQVELHVYSQHDIRAYQVDNWPAHSRMGYRFSFKAPQILPNDAFDVFFVYNIFERRRKTISHELDLSDLQDIPFTFFYGQRTPGNGLSPVNIVDSGPGSYQKLAIDNSSLCCGEEIVETFFVEVVIEGQTACESGWHQGGTSCYLLNIMNTLSWIEARIKCNELGADLTVVDTPEKVTDLFGILKRFNTPRVFSVGLTSELQPWRWINGDLLTNQSFWGVGEPSGDGMCLDLLHAESWNPAWKGLGWRWNDENCNFFCGYICEKKLEESKSCETGWQQVNQSCFLFVIKERLPWVEARYKCQTAGGDLAIVDNEPLRKQISDLLSPDVLRHMFIGSSRRLFRKWSWLNGHVFNRNLWGPYQPSMFGECGAVYLATKDNWRFGDLSCQTTTGFICEKKEVSLSFGGLTSSSAAIPGAKDSSLAVDGIHGTCYVLQKEIETWWEVDIGSDRFIYKIQVTSRVDCCSPQQFEFKVGVGRSSYTRDNAHSQQCTEVVDLRVSGFKTVTCEPPVLGRYVTIFIPGKTGSVSLCEVAVYGSDKSSFYNGVLREAWFGIPGSSLGNLKSHDRFPSNPDGVTVISDFDSPFNFADNYGQRLSAHIQLADDGNYTFFVTCDEMCELWLQESHGIELSIGNRVDGEENTRKVMLANVLEGYPTKRSEWEKYPSLQTSQEITLSKCKLYFLEAFMKEDSGSDSLAVGVKFPNGTYERPVKQKRLFWTMPGVRRLVFNVTLNHQSRVFEVGEWIHFSASYKFCCSGPYCPNCSLRLNVYVLEQVIPISQSLNVDCTMRTFKHSLEVISQPGRYNIEIGYAFRENLQFKEVRRNVQEIEVKALVLDQCTFKETTCAWKRKPPFQGWTFASENVEKQVKGHAILIDNLVVASLERDWTSSVRIHDATGLCLRFQFMLPSESDSSLIVYLEDPTNRTLLWSLRGFHGSKWMTGQVSWRSATVKKIIIQGNGRINQTVTVALADVAMSTETCHVIPEHAAPGYTCTREDMFLCDNRACINEGLVCNGDEDCLDGSDENNCKCILSEFTCLSGECISVEKLCDSTKDCTDGSDESRCDTGCGDHFSCSDGSCIPWMFTCDGQTNCEDGSDEPLICRDQECSLISLSCKEGANSHTISDKSCSEFRGRCVDENSYCGFQHHSGELQWLMGKGETPTKGTGPSYDHTTYSQDGRYFYIEASGQRPKDKARITSDWVESNDDRCLEFWYFMYGDDVGSLNVYKVTNGSERVLWNKIGNQGSRWKLAQVYLGKPTPYKVVVEGVVGQGKKSDIAIDDLSVLEEDCPMENLNDSPHCYFDEGFCSWHAEEGWKLSKMFPPTFEKNHEDSHSLDGFVYLQHGQNIVLVSSPGNSGNLLTSLVSPQLTRSSEAWKCLKVWILIGASYTGKVGEIIINEMALNGSLQVRRRFAESSSGWTYVQLPLAQSTARVVIQGRKTQSDQIIAVDDISFSPVTCEDIPWAGKQDANELPLNWTDTGDGIPWTITHKSEFELHAAANNATNFRREEDPNDYEVHLKWYKGGFFRARLLLGLKELSVCLWLKTDKIPDYCVSLFYGTVLDGNKVTGVRLSGCDFLKVVIMDRQVSTSVSVDGDDWKFLCVTWRSQGGLFEVYKDGKRRTVGKGFQPGKIIPGNGEFTVGPDFDGRISAVNVWDRVLASSDVYWMSVGCGKAIMNPVINWPTLLADSIGNVSITGQASCNTYKEGPKLVSVRSSLDQTNKTALRTSPFYERSDQNYGKCMRFRYIVHGKMTVLQLLQLTNYSKGKKKLLWTETAHSTAISEWNYGQVSLATTTNHQLFLRGHFGEFTGYVAIAGVHVVSGYCSEFAEQANQACNVTLTQPRGQFSSPLYPGYYANNAYCQWRITAPAGHVIRLSITMFELEDREACDRDFVAIFDGPSRFSPPIGRFCGHSYSPVVKSSKQHLLVTFTTNHVKFRNGFEASYSTELAQVQRNQSCDRLEGCPTNCDCFVTAESKLVVEGRGLSVVPQQFPTATKALLLSRNRISHIPETAFSSITGVEHIDVSENTIKSVFLGSLSGLRSLTTLRLNLNFLTQLPSGLFSELEDLESLDLSNNLLHKVAVGVFWGLKSLQVLSLHSNMIDDIDQLGFINLENVTHLYLQNNLIRSVPDNLFAKMDKLQTLRINNNKIKRLNEFSFKGLSSLNTLFLQDNPVTDVHEQTFSELQNLRHLRLDHYIWCCFAEKLITAADFQCISPANEFSSCNDLMKNNTLRISVWFLGLMALLGNLMVIVLRLLVREDNKVHTLLLTNLAVADMLMGAYLLIVAIKDLEWQGEYFKHDIDWRSGHLCQLAGALSMISSEASVLLLSFITLDRLVCIVFPFRFGRISRKSAIIVVFFIWLFSVTMALVPCVDRVNYFRDVRWDIGFYGRSSICLPLQLSSEKIAGWEYSVGIFIALNFASFIFIFVAYIAMFLTVRKMTRAIRSTHMSRESAMAKRMVFIIMTDLCCWMPIIMIGIFSLTGQFHDPDKQVYVWLAVFVLPVNSSLNPVLYTFSTPRIRRRLLGMASGAGSVEQPGEKLVGTKKTVTDQNELTLPISRFGILKGRASDDIAHPSKVTVIRVCNALQETTNDVICLEAKEESQGMSRVVLKCYPNDLEQEWKGELEIARRLRQNRNHPNVMAYLWHCQVSSTIIDQGTYKIPTLKKDSLLICYDYVSDTNLNGFLRDGARLLTYDLLVTIAIDVISGIEFLASCGVAHNNVNPSTVLIKKSIPIPPIVAVLGVGAAIAIEEGYVDTEEAQSLFRNDIRQFGQLLATLLGHCNGSSEYTESIMSSCFDEGSSQSMCASDIKQKLEGLLCKEIWDTAI